ncbi:MAG TPA: transcription antitermination factor NusB [Gammaproteobacteria bacterium]|nr:transcription antitermination factor NusB [Gammaproteobacteria bacterium]|tara:strand:+ start:156 stop:617 length:462 start_codon:yes stop_codon:yes gene_type:complete
MGELEANQTKLNIGARKKARRALVQAAYQWQVNQSPVDELIAEFAESSLNHADTEFFAAIIRAVIAATSELDALIAPLLDRPIKQLDLVERGILRVAAVELKNRIDVPYRVVIDEYVELTKRFGAQDAYRFVNGVLDKLAADLRRVEVAADTR